jgi:hypothetical protein
LGDYIREFYVDKDAYGIVLNKLSLKVNTLARRAGKRINARQTHIPNARLE